MFSLADGLLYAIGGYNGCRLSSGEVYDPARDSWSSIASMEKHRTHFSACVLRQHGAKQIHVIGGMQGRGSTSQLKVVPYFIISFTLQESPTTSTTECLDLDQERCCGLQKSMIP